MKNISLILVSILLLVSLNGCSETTNVLSPNGKETEIQSTTIEPETEPSESTTSDTDDYEYIDFENSDWANATSIIARRFFNSVDFTFEEGDIIPINSIIEYYRLFEMLNPETGELNEDLLQYRTHPDSDIFLESVEISIPKEIVNAKLEKYFSVKIDGSSSEFTDPKNDDCYLLTHSARGGVGIAVKDYEKNGNITTATYATFDVFDYRIYKKIELCIENEDSEENFRIIYAREVD